MNVGRLVGRCPPRLWIRFPYHKDHPPKVLLPHLSPERKVITAEFKDFRNGQLKMIQIFVKKARGMMAKFIIEEKISDEKDLIKFDKEGYQFDGNLSTENKLVFTR